MSNQEGYVPYTIDIINSELNSSEILDKEEELMYEVMASDKDIEALNLEELPLSDFIQIDYILLSTDGYYCVITTGSRRGTGLI